MNVIETQHLTKIYSNNYIALNDMNLSIPQGAVFGLIGPNGAGKSTTIRLLLGLHNPTAGEVKVFGEPMNASAVDLRRRVGFLPTNPRFPQGLNAITYLDFVGKLCGVPKQVRKPRLASLLRAVGLLSASSQQVNSYSTGMITRLGIAASLMNDPELLIWDEPTSGLDPEGQKYTIDLIHELGRHKTIVVSSHHLADLKQVCTHIGIISDGKLIFNGPISEMKRLTRAHTIALELAGDVEAVRVKLNEALPTTLAYQRGSTLEVTLDDAQPIANQVVQVLQLVATSGTPLVTIHSLDDDMVDAFIRLLDEERSHGFARLFQTDTPAAALLRHTGD